MVRFLIAASGDPDIPDRKQRCAKMNLHNTNRPLKCIRSAADRIWNNVFGKANDEVTEKMFVEMFSSTSRMEQLERRNFSHLHNIVLGQVLGDLNLELQTPCGRKAINCVDSEGVSPLIWAARRGDDVAVDTLIRHGADVSLAQHTGATAFYYASISPSPGAAAVVRSLLEAGAPVNARSVRGETPLHLAVIYKDDPKNFIAPLLEYGADVNACDVKGISILDAAIQSDHANSVAFLLEVGVTLDKRSEDHVPGLSAAVIHNSHKVLKLLMERGADSSIVSTGNKTLLHQAAAYADNETLEILTEYSLDIGRDTKDSSGLTAKEVFDRRDDKEIIMIKTFEHLLENLGSQSIIFGYLDEKDVTAMGGRPQLQDMEEPVDDMFFDAKEDWSCVNPEESRGSGVQGVRR
jgi:uncharacterized protein